MEALADFNMGSFIANNANYSGGVVKTPSSQSFQSSRIVDGLKDAIASRGVSTIAKTVLPRVNPYVGVASLVLGGAKLAYDKYQSDNEPVVQIIKHMGADESTVPDYAQNFANYQGESLKNLGTSLEGINDGLTSSTAPTLPEVMTSNASALVQSLNALTLSFQENLGYVASGIFGISAFLEQLVTLKQAQLQFSQEVEAVKLEKTELQKESYEFKKTSKVIQDLDGEVVATMAPREAELAKNATVGRKVTDENNFELDDDDIDISMPIDISSCFGYEKYSDMLKNVLNSHGGNWS